VSGGAWIRSALLDLAIAAATACSSTGPSAEPWGGRADTTLALRIGQEVGARDSVMRVSFLGVRADSRCPVDVLCVWQGDADVEIGVRFGMGPTVPYVLHTGVEPRSVVVGGYRITLVSLRPAPVSTTSIPPEQYVAELRLELVAEP
jgi:hypothetical protein